MAPVIEFGELPAQIDCTLGSGILGNVASTMPYLDADRARDASGCQALHKTHPPMQHDVAEETFGDWARSSPSCNAAI